MINKMNITDELKEIKETVRKAFLRYICAHIGEEGAVGMIDLSAFPELYEDLKEYVEAFGARHKVILEAKVLADDIEVRVHGWGDCSSWMNPRWPVERATDRWFQGQEDKAYKFIKSFVKAMKELDMESVLDNYEKFKQTNIYRYVQTRNKS